MNLCSRICGVLSFPREPRELFYYAGLSVRSLCGGGSDDGEWGLGGATVIVLVSLLLCVFGKFREPMSASIRTDRATRRRQPMGSAFTGGFSVSENGSISVLVTKYSSCQMASTEEVAAKPPRPR